MLRLVIRLKQNLPYAQNIQKTPNARKIKAESIRVWEWGTGNKSAVYHKLSVFTLEHLVMPKKEKIFSVAIFRSFQLMLSAQQKYTKDKILWQNRATTHTVLAIMRKIDYSGIWNTYVYPSICT